MKFALSTLLLLIFAFVTRAQDKFILVTQGGGVTGAAVVYKIQEDGKVYKGKGVVDFKFEESSEIGRCRKKRYFKKTRSLLSQHPNFNHPGNMYSSLTLAEAGGEKKITWGEKDLEAPVDAKKLYEKINTKLGKLTFAPELRK